MKRRSSRRRKTPPPAAGAKKKVPKLLPQLSAMSPPNHMVGLDVFLEKELRKDKGLVIKRRSRWPIMMARREDSSGLLASVFIAEEHGKEFWVDWADHPPSWMDPAIFIRMARKDKECRRLMRICYQRESLRAFKLLKARMQIIFEEEYLPFMFEQFDESVGLVFAEWLMANYIAKQEHPNTGP